MSAKFEQSIHDWYEQARTVDLHLSTLPTDTTPKLYDISSNTEHNIQVVYDRLLLLSKISLKYFHQILEKQAILTDSLFSISCSLADLQRGLQTQATQLQASLDHHESSLRQILPVAQTSPKPPSTRLDQLTTEVQQLQKLVLELHTALI